MSNPSSYDHSAPTKKSGGGFALLSLLLNLIAPLVLIIAMLSTSSGYMDYELGFVTLTLNYAPKIATASFVIAMIILLIALFKDPSRTGLLAFIAALIGGAVLLGFYAYEKIYKANPPIHDVATDWATPLTLSDDLVRARGKKALPIEDDPIVSTDATFKWARMRVSAINALTCPAAKPIFKHLDSEKVVKILESQGYVIFGKAQWRVEATHTSRFYGFETDVEVRLNPDRTDVRMINRRQDVDLGANCVRMTRLMTALRAIN